MSNISDTRFACEVTDYMAAVVDNKMYITGGYNLVCNATSSGCFNNTATAGPIANNDLLVLDFTKQFTYNPNSVGIRTRVHPQVPHVRWGTLWGVDGKLYQFGGEANRFPAEAPDGGPAPQPRPSLGTSVWEYDIATAEWEEAPQETEWGGVVEPVAHGASACGKGDVCYLLLGRTETKYDGSLLAYNVKARKWLDMSGVRGSMDRVYGAKMLYIEALDMLVVIGGATIDPPLTRAMNTINLFYIPTKTWFTVQAKGGPGSRLDFCTGAVSAEDGSSHNIYLFGGAPGLNPVRPPPPYDKIGESNVWVLSLPSFRWMYAGGDFMSRDGLSCAIIDKKYLITFSGSSPRTESMRCDTRSVEGVMWDVSRDIWTGLYKPPVGPGKPQYRVSRNVYEVIGGNEEGGANHTLMVERDLDPELQSIFEEAVRTGNDSEAETMPETTGKPISTSTPEALKEGPGKPNTTGAIAGGVVGGVVAAVVILLVVWWMRRRRSGSRKTGVPVQVGPSELHVMGAKTTMQGKVEAPADELPGELEGWQKYEVMGSTPVVEMEGSTVGVDESRRPR